MIRDEPQVRPARRRRALRVLAWVTGLILAIWLVPPLVILLAAGLH